jgi:monofunctional biosynthetic peptidoglycan transglycosylase
MEVYLNVAETGIGTYGVNAGSERYFGHDASAMSATEAARIAAVLPLPKERGAIAPKGFTRRYGNIIAARIPIVARDALDACVYKGTIPPPTKAPPSVTKKPRPQPGEEYESPRAAPAQNAPEQVPPDSAEPQTAPAPQPAEAPTVNVTSAPSGAEQPGNGA